MSKFQSVKVIDGFSTCFRQWKAEGTHCKFLHGYAVSFHVTFEGPLDYRNWVMDFGFMKRSKTTITAPGKWQGREYAMPLSVGDWFKHMFDHTVVLAEDDPLLQQFKDLEEEGALHLRVLPQVGCERFAELVANKLNEFLYKETDDRVRVVRVECFEHAKNSAIFIP